MYRPTIDLIPFASASPRRREQRHWQTLFSPYVHIGDNKVVRESSLWWWTIVDLRSGGGRSTLAVGSLRGPASPQVVLHANAHHRPASLGCDCYDGLLQQ